MYVCLCKGVTDREIRAEVRAGATRMRDLRERLGVAESCGVCAPCARDVLITSLYELEAEDRPPLGPLASVNAT